MVNDDLLYRGNPKNRPLPEIFEQEDLNKIFKQIIICPDYPKNDWGEFQRKRDLTLVFTIYILGLRPREATNLKFSDINMRTTTIHISWKSNKTKSERTIPIPKVLITILKNYLSLPRERFWKGSPYLFPSMENQHISPERLKTIFREKVLKPTGLWEMPKESKVPKIRLYTLRHSRATQILRRQIMEDGKPDIYMIANFLGHKDIRSTTVYLHKNKEYTEYMRDRLEL